MSLSFCNKKDFLIGSPKIKPHYYLFSSGSNSIWDAIINLPEPFEGSTTTGFLAFPSFPFAVSELLGRKWIGFELGNCEIIKDRLENKEKDRKLFEKVYEEKNKLFPDKVKELRKKNSLWTDDDFKTDTEKKETEKDTKKSKDNFDQISLSLKW